MTILIDDPIWPKHATLWGHLVSDVSLAELHSFAGRAGIPLHGFDNDHYDYPEYLRETLITLGALPVSARELLRALQDSGLRVRQRDKN